MDEAQLPLFEGVKEEDFPEDIQRDMNVLMGNYVPTDSEEVEQKKVIDELSGQKAQPPGMPSRMAGDPDGFISNGLLKKTDRVDKFQVMEDPIVKVLDIANAEDQAILQDIYKAIGDPRNKLTGNETPPQILLDPSSPRGFRTIVVIKYWKTTQQMSMSKMPGQ